MSEIVDYTDVVPLKEMKSYLRIDNDNTDFDLEVTTMIDSACNLIESYTQVYLKPQSKTYYFNCDDYIRIYAYPIVGITDPATDADYNVEVKQLYSIYTRTSTALEEMTFNIGLADTDNVKSIFKTAIEETVRLWFYGAETETVNKGIIPTSVMAILGPERRFIF